MQRYKLSPRGKLYLKTDAEGKPDDYIKSLKILLLWFFCNIFD